MVGEPALYGRMELRLKDAERQLARFVSVTDKRMGEMEKRTLQASTRMQTFMSGAAAGMGKAMTGAGVAAAAALAIVLAVTSQTKAALDEFGNIADKSAQSGLDAEFFQELAYGASLAGVGMDDLSSSLNTFNKNSGLAVVGKGKMVAALQKLNPALLENIRNAKDQEERVRLAADAIDKAKTAAEKAALATTLFGNAGAALVPVFNGGAGAIDQMAQKAQALGIVVDRDLIARADELGDEFDTATRVMDVQFKQALVNLAPALVAAANLAANVATAISRIVDSMRAVENQSTRGLNEQMAEIGVKRLDLENQILEAQEAQRKEVEKLSDTAKNLGFANSQNPVLPGGNVEALKAESAELKKQELSVLAILDARRKASEEAKVTGGTDNAGDDGNETLPPITPPGSSRNTAAADAIKQAEAVKELIANLEYERSLVGKSELEQAKMNALRDAGAAATDEQKAQIIALIEATSREKAAVESVQSALSDLNDTAKDVAGTIIRGFRDGASAGEILSDVMTKISDKAIDMALNQIFTPGGGGLLSTLFGGLFGTTPVAAPGAGATGANKVVSANTAKLTASANMAKAATAKASAPVEINLINNSSATVRQEEGSDGKGGRRQNFVIEDAVSGAFRPGSAVNRTVRNTFNVKQRLIQR